MYNDEDSIRHEPTHVTCISWKCLTKHRMHINILMKS
jgi:hypothetical protein